MGDYPRSMDGVPPAPRRRRMRLIHWFQMAILRELRFCCVVRIGLILLFVDVGSTMRGRAYKPQWLHSSVVFALLSIAAASTWVTLS